MQLDSRQTVSGKPGAIQMMRFQQMAEFQQGRRIRCRFSIQINANKAANGLTIVYGILGAFIRKTKALLHNVHAQYSLKTNRWVTSFATNRIMRGDDIQ